METANQTSAERASLESWLRRLIGYYRKRALQLSPEQQRQLTWDLGQPLQVHVLWSANDQRGSSYIVLVLTHISNMPDMFFKIVGPFAPSRFSEMAGELLEAEYWGQELPVQQFDLPGISWAGPSTYRDDLIMALRGQQEAQRRYYTQRAMLSPGHLNDAWAEGQGISPNGDFLHVIWGDFRKIDPQTLIDPEIKYLEANLARIRKPDEVQTGLSSPPQRQKPNYAAFVFPPLWIGPRPTQSIKDQIEGSFVHAKVSLKADYGESTFMLRQDGLFEVRLPESVPEHARKTQSLEALNQLFAALLLLGVEVETAREHDLVETSIDPQEMSVRGVAWNPSAMRRPADSTRMDGYLDITSWSWSPGLTFLPGDKLDEALELARALSSDKIKSQLSLLLLEASTLFRNAEYSQAFLATWQILEIHLGIVWHSYIEARKIGGDRKRHLADTNRWSVDYVLEVLQLGGELDKTEYSEVMTLKKKRNKMVHSGEPVAEAEARRGLEWAAKVTSAACGLIQKETNE